MLVIRLRQILPMGYSESNTFYGKTHYCLCLRHIIARVSDTLLLVSHYCAIICKQYIWGEIWPQ